MGQTIFFQNKPYEVFLKSGNLVIAGYDLKDEMIVQKITNVGQPAIYLAHALRHLLANGINLESGFSSYQLKAVLNVAELALGSAKERAEAAYSQDCPLQILHILLTDPELAVKRSALANPIVPTSELFKAISEAPSDDEFLQICPILAKNPSTPTAILDLIAERSNKNVYYLKNILVHSNCSGKLLEEIAQENSFLSSLAASNPNFPMPSNLNNLSMAARTGLATNPNCSLELKKMLALDTNLEVRTLMASQSGMESEFSL